ncbi:MAG: alpha/beta hydrolase [Legionella sp.]|nr:alpha/beta hydrolase [Legionella sp.]
MPIITVNNLDIYYELHGRGKPLVLIAGYTGDHTFWNLMLDELAQKFQVLIFDNRGIGQTKDNGTFFTLDTMAEDTFALTEKLGLAHPHILGQSMGGTIAQILAKKYADKIDKLILLNSAAKFSLRTQMTLESLLNLRKANTSFDLFIDTALPWFFSSDYLSKRENITNFKQALLDAPYPQSIGDQERQYKALSGFDSRSWLQDIRPRTLVIAAKDDIIAQPDDSKALAMGITGSKFVMITGAHSSPVEQPHEVNKNILRFLL